MPVRGVTGYLLSQQHPHEVGEALLPQEAGDMVGDHDRRLDLAAAEAMQIGATASRETGPPKTWSSVPSRSASAQA